ncbi:MAG: DNA-processing protein DprA [Planctomycetota bacterium]
MPHPLGTSRHCSRVHDAHLLLAIAEGFDESPVPSLLPPGEDPEAVLADPPAPPTVPARVAARLRRRNLGEIAAAIRRRCDELGLRVLTPLDRDWPPRLSAQPIPPLVLFVRGDASVLRREPAIAIVGSRSPTPYGVDAASTLAEALALAGAVLWSGLARGIDAVAHRSSVAAGTPTVAVLAGGLDTVYPAEHATLADEIVAGGGCLCSELPPGHRARRGHFVRRNRLLAAGPPAVLVVEASLASGALHTARFAADCATEVFALPGPWRSERSMGCHRLLAEGALVVEDPAGLLQALGLGAASSPAAALALVHSADEACLLTLLASGPRPGDLLRRESGLEAGPFLRALFALEQRGVLQRLPGDLWRRR